jgi:hypothetical protein
MARKLSRSFNGVVALTLVLGLPKAKEKVRMLRFSAVENVPHLGSHPTHRVMASGFYAKIDLRLERRLLDEFLERPLRFKSSDPVKGSCSKAVWTVRIARFFRRRSPSGSTGGKKELWAKA